MTFSKSIQKRIEAQTGEKLFTRQEQEVDALVAAALALFAQRAAEIADDEWKLDEHNEGHPEFHAKYGCVDVGEAIRKLVPDPNALAEHDAALRRELVKEADAMIATAERRARLEEAKLWDRKFHPIHRELNTIGKLMTWADQRIAELSEEQHERT